MTKEELAKFCNVSVSTIETNFPLFCSRQLKKGYIISKEGKGMEAKYQIEKTEPKIVDKSYFSTRTSDIAVDLPNEIWKETYCSNLHEVSNLGRIRNRKTKTLVHGSIHDGYLVTELKGGKKYRVHRVVK